jgi:hypothetical protein
MHNAMRTRESTYVVFFYLFCYGSNTLVARIVVGLGYGLSIKYSKLMQRKERVNRGGPYKERACSVLHTRTRLNDVCYSEYGLN